MKKSVEKWGGIMGIIYGSFSLHAGRLIGLFIIILASLLYILVEETD